MGDLSSEPSMEEILSSIKRIIAEEGEAAPGRARRTGRTAQPAPVEDEVLELSDPMPQERPADAIRPEPARAEPSRPETVRAETTRPEPARPAERARVADESAPPATPAVETRAPDPAPKPSSSPAAERPDPVPAAATIVSSGTVEATRGALDQLSRMLIKPEPSIDGTLEGLVREMLRPMLRDWLDASLPSLVEDMVAREIAKITASRR